MTRPFPRYSIMALSSFASTVRSSWERYRTYRTSVRELGALDDRQLADIGIDRSKIREVARRSIA
jgi:uncharacterized protein YjiS (DUF1127 family)